MIALVALAVVTVCFSLVILWVLWRFLVAATGGACSAGLSSAALDSPTNRRSLLVRSCSCVTLVDVGPRDGLQNEKQNVDAAVKIELVHRLQAAGLREIEVTSFVSPKWVPQMADNAAVMAGIERQPGVRYSVLIPNMKGLDAALSAPRA